MSQGLALLFSDGCSMNILREEWKHREEEPRRSTGPMARTQRPRHAHQRRPAFRGCDQFLPDVGRICPDLANAGSMIDQIRPKSVIFGLEMAKLGRTLAGLSQMSYLVNIGSTPTVGQVWPSLATLVKCGETGQMCSDALGPSTLALRCLQRCSGHSEPSCFCVPVSAQKGPMRKDGMRMRRHERAQPVGSSFCA